MYSCFVPFTVNQVVYSCFFLMLPNLFPWPYYVYKYFEIKINYTTSYPQGYAGMQMLIVFFVRSVYKSRNTFERRFKDAWKKLKVKWTEAWKSLKENWKKLERFKEAEEKIERSLKENWKKIERSWKENWKKLERKLKKLERNWKEA